MNRFQGPISWFWKLDAGVQTVRFQSVVFVGAFHISRRVSDENIACPISIHFFKSWICVLRISQFELLTSSSERPPGFAHPFPPVARVFPIIFLPGEPGLRSGQIFQKLTKINDVFYFQSTFSRDY